jgi:hypothetical protein
MVIQSAVTSVRLKRECRSSAQSAIVPPQRIPIIAHMAAQTFVALMVLGLCVTAIVRISNTAAKDIDPPHHLLPGSPRPANAACDSLHDGQFRCYVIHGGREIYLGYDGASEVIVNTVVSASEHTIGDLMIAWGTPTGFTQNGRTIEVNWGTRSAYLHTCSFQPTSRVGYIEYSLESKQLSPWHGFIRSAEHC